MSTFSVSLTTSEEELIENLTVQNPGATPHLVHLAALRIGLREVQGNPETLRFELLEIAQERRERRAQKKEAE